MTKLRRTISFLLIVIVLSASSQICVTANAAGADDLQYSTYISTPNNYNSTNCYGYAIGRAQAVDPGYYSSTSYSSFNAFKSCIIADLTALGYTVRNLSSSSSSINSNEIMIAFFYGTWQTQPTSSGDFGEMHSYHFWRKTTSSGSWYHKYGRQSGIMRFNYIPKSSNISRVCDEYYNGITHQYNPASFYGITGNWGYLAFNYYDIVSPSSSYDVNLDSDNRATTGELDHSAAAMIERYVRARCASNNN